MRRILLVFILVIAGCGAQSPSGAPVIQPSGTTTTTTQNTTPPAPEPEPSRCDRNSPINGYCDEYYNARGMLFSGANIKCHCQTDWVNKHYSCSQIDTYYDSILPKLISGRFTSSCNGSYSY